MIPCRSLLALLMVGFLPTPLVAPAPAASPPPTHAAGSPAATGDPRDAAALDALRPAAARLLGEALASRQAHRRLEELCDDIGHRLSGSPALERAVEWAAQVLRDDGLVNVRAEPVLVPHWVRGAERAFIEAPTRHDLTILGLGGSVGTPPGGLSAEVVVVGRMAELDSLGAERIRGRIVLFDVPFESYGQAVLFRVNGASRAAKLGAAAMLVRSVTPVSLDTPHTGSLRYSDDAPRIPAAAVTIEDATRIRRLTRRGKTVRVHLEMGATTLEDAPSANVVGEILGRERPEEIVVLGGHLDSWDVGQGAQDDGTGCVISLEAARLIHRLGLRPRRTIRVVLWTNEENGLRGARGYRDAHRDELGRHVAALESDMGNGRVRGFEVDLRPRLGVAPDSAGQAEAERLESGARDAALARVRALAPFFEPLSATRIQAGGAGADVGPLAEEGVACLGLSHDPARYFDIHHTRADTFEKVDPLDLAHNVAAMALMTYLLAEMPDRLLPPSTPQAPTDR